MMVRAGHQGLGLVYTGFGLVHARASHTLGLVIQGLGLVYTRASRAGSC